MFCALDQAAEYRALAAERRNRGAGGSVRVFASHRARDAARGGIEAAGSHDRFIAELRARWEFSRSDAIEAYVFAAFPERHFEVAL